MLARVPRLWKRATVATLVVGGMLMPASPALHAETSFHKLEKRLRKLEKKSGSALDATARNACTAGKWLGEAALDLGILWAIDAYEDLLENGPPEHSTAPNPPSSGSSSNPVLTHPTSTGASHK